MRTRKRVLTDNRGPRRKRTKINDAPKNLEYKDIEMDDDLINAISLYKMIGIRDGDAISPYQPFLMRNLSFLQAWKQKKIKDVKFNNGNIIFPLMWNGKKPKRGLIKRSVSEKRDRLSNLVNKIKRNANKGIKKLQNGKRTTEVASVDDQSDYEGNKLHKNKSDIYIICKSLLSVYCNPKSAYEVFIKKGSRTKRIKANSVFNNVKMLTLYPKSLKYYLKISSTSKDKLLNLNADRYGNATISQEYKLLESECSDPLECVICSRKFKTLFHVLLHYHLSYPRLVFTFSAPNTTNGVEELSVTIALNIHYRDVDEVSYRRRHTSQTTWFVIPSIAKQIKKNMKMDLTMFFFEYVDSTPIDCDNIRRARQVKPAGLCGSRIIENPRTKNLPQPNYEILVKSYRESIFDYVDVTYVCKIFMFTWNTMIVKIGSSRCAVIGSYRLFELYIFTHKSLIELHGSEFKEVVKDAITSAYLREQGCPASGSMNAFTKARQLILRLDLEDYDPFTSVHSCAIFELWNTFLPNLHKQYKKDKKRAKKKQYHRFARENLSLKVSLSDTNTLRAILHESLNTNLIPPRHTIRMLCEKPGDFLTKDFGLPEIPKCFFEIPEYPPCTEDDYLLVHRDQLKTCYVQDCIWYLANKNTQHIWKKTTD